MSNALNPRIERHLAACAGLAAAAGVAQSSPASIVYSGTVNIPIPNDSGGVYLNVVTRVTGSTRGATPGWDINPYFGANLFFTEAPGYATVDDGTGFNRVANLAAGTLIDSANATNNHSGDGSNFPTSAPGGYYGFRFRDESAGNALRYGWAQVIRGGAGQNGTIVAYAYENSGAGIPAGAIPTPGSLGVLALGAAALTGRRRNEAGRI